MAEEIPSVEEIMGLAQRIPELAVQKRAKYELPWFSEDTDPAVHPELAPYEQTRATGQGTQAEYAALRAQYAWIPGFFSSHIQPDPSGFDHLIDAARSSGAALCDIPDHGGPAQSTAIDTAYNNTVTTLSGWTGVAATVFRSDFLNKIPEAASAQASVAWALRLTMEANKNVFVKARQDLRNVAQQTINALEAIGADGGARIMTALGVVAAVAAVVGAVAGGVGTGGVLTAAGALAAVNIIGALSGGAAIFGGGGDKKEVPLGADTVDGVIQNMLDAIIKISEAVRDQEQLIADALDKGYETMTGKGHDTLLPPRPHLIEDSRDRDIKDSFVTL